MNAADAFTLFSEMELVTYMVILVTIDIAIAVFLYWHSNKNTKNIIAVLEKMTAFDNKIKSTDLEFKEFKIKTSKNFNKVYKNARRQATELKEDNQIFKNGIDEKWTTLNAQYIKLNKSTGRIEGMLEILVPKKEEDGKEEIHSSDTQAGAA